MLCSWSCSVFCYGFSVDACSRYETKEVCCVVDCWEYSFPLQVIFFEGSLLTNSFAALQGPMAYIKHLVSPTRLPFTAGYFGSLGLTLYFAIGVDIPLIRS